MKKKNYLNALGIALTVMLCSSVAACDDDNENEFNVSPSKASVSAFSKATGMHISSCGDYRFHYNEQSLTDYIEDKQANRWYFGYEPNLIVYSEKGSRTKSCSVTYEKNGFLTSISMSDSTHTYDHKASIRYSAVISYNDGGHLKAISVSTVSSGSDYTGSQETETRTMEELWLTWRSDNLDEATYEYQCGEDSWIKSFVFTYNDSASTNTYCQWVPSLDEILDLDASLFTEAFAYIGLLGQGPNKLPSACEVIQTWPNGRNGSGLNGETIITDHTFSYVFNSDGTVAYTVIDGTRKAFTYEKMNNAKAK